MEFEEDIRPVRQLGRFGAVGVHKKVPSWLKVTDKGLYCEPGDFYVDPAFPVDRAVVTHGHADHARPGSQAVIGTPETIAIMEARYKERHAVSPQALKYHEPITIGGVGLRFVPAGHVLGSAQAVLEYDGARVIVTGDYKRRRDPTCLPFEPVGCDVLITEATFGLPVFTHPDDGVELQTLIDSLETFPERTHLLGVYALGKFQRVLVRLRELGYHEEVFVHGAMEGLASLYERLGVSLGKWSVIRPSEMKTKNQDFAGRLVFCPPSAIGDRWSRRFVDPIPCMASGWMRVRARARQKHVELPLVISDHCDWNELTETLHEVDPQALWVTHGREDGLVHYARTHGYDAEALHLVGLEDESE